MGYDIDIGNTQFYMTYNHAAILRKYDVYPRDLIDLDCYQVSDRLMKAIQAMRANNVQSVTPNSSVHFKYMTELMYQNDEGVVMGILQKILGILITEIPSGTWQSD